MIKWKKFRFGSRLSLIQQFNLLIVCSLLLIAIYLGYYASHRLRDDLKDLYQTYITRQIQMTAKTYLLNSSYFDADQAHQNYDELTSQLKALERSRLQSDSQNAAVGIVLFDLQGRIVWDENADRLGEQRSDAKHIQEVAATGIPRVDFITDTQSSAFSEYLLEHIQGSSKSFLLRMLIPVTSKPAREDIESSLFIPVEDIEGVLEVILHPGWLFERHKTTRKRIFEKVTVVSGVLYLILFWLFSHASGIIKKQAEELQTQQTLTQLGQMAGYLAHEIRNPLFVIRSSAQTLQEEFPEENDQRKVWADFIVEEVDRLNSLVNDLLGLVRKDQHHKLSIASVSEAVAVASNRILPQAPGLQLSNRIEPTSNKVMFDQDQLIQIFTNLLRNCRDALPQGGEVTISTRTVSKEFVEIKFSDNGPGIPDEIAKQIFNPFFTQKEGGTGLGLSIVKRLVEANQATIYVKARQQGQGACFVINCHKAPSHPHPGTDTR